MFRVTVSGPREQEASFFTVVVWRDQAEHVAESLSKGSRIVMVRSHPHMSAGGAHVRAPPASAQVWVR
jgi:Single-strand binding protein family